MARRPVPDMRMAAATRNADKEKPMRKRTARYGHTPVPSSLEAAWMRLPGHPQATQTDGRMPDDPLRPCVLPAYLSVRMRFLAIFGDTAGARRCPASRPTGGATR